MLRQSNSEELRVRGIEIGTNSAPSAHKFDRTILVAVGLLLIVGILMVYSASNAVSREHRGDSYYFFRMQVVWCLIGLAAMVGTSRVVVNRSLRIMEEKGAIRLERRRIVIVDEDVLKELVSASWQVLSKKKKFGQAT